MQSSQQVLPKNYNPQEIEDKWYSYWEERGCFHAVVDPDKEPFCIVIPPPNVTGQLHNGHALDETYQDILVRFQRMQGRNVLWVPGTDHAGIATQARVESHIRQTEGQSRHDLGREQFLERVWAWKEQYGGLIISQLKKLGSSCDWSRERFTMDDGCSRAVTTVFVRLFNKGLIYQGHYSVHWCPHCSTTLSDIEVEHKEHAGYLYHIRYPFSDGEGFVEIATTRPETMLGDTAVAVNPDDKRYKNLIGRNVRVPLIERDVPVIADDYVDAEFGTGIVKITPAHDPNDFEVGLRHGLAKVDVIGRDANMTEAAGSYAGLERYACREAIVAQLQEQGLLVRTEEHSHAVGQCYRCDTVVEPLVSRQWFVRMKPLAEPAIAAVRNGTIRFVPERFARQYLNWMENIRDWCISRQLWWGHRIPVWYCKECSHTFAVEAEPAACPACQSTALEQDPDVLDTWFSSALWPFSTLGWPDATPELEHFYPTSVLVTGFDIIPFWVARMIVMGLECTGQQPFDDVLIHGLVRDAQGRKMSKSLGNGVDPLDVIEAYGADALRFTLVIGVAPGNDMRYQTEKVEAYRNFANKIWNASRFALMNLTDFCPAETTLQDLASSLTTADQWIVSRYERTVQELTRLLERYDVGEGARLLYDFIWSDVCDWYIELIKGRLYGRFGDESRYAAQYVLWYVLKHTLQLLHPYMPFITEELWQQLPHEGDTIMLAPWPQETECECDLRSAEQTMVLLQDVITAVRTLRSEKQVPPGRRIQMIACADAAKRAVLDMHRDELQALAGVETLELAEPGTKHGQAVTSVVQGVEIHLPLAGLVDREQELARIAKELQQAAAALERARTKLDNPGFVNQAPEAVVEKERAKVTSLEETVTKLATLRKELENA